MRWLWFGFIMLFAAALLADDASVRFLWEEANARMATARTPDACLEAANNYNQLVAAGVRNGPLFFNLGTALLLAGDGANAAAAFRRAERYLGSNPDLRRDLRQAMALQSGQTDADLPWDQLVFFWHYDAPLRVRTLVALCGWIFLWLGLILRLLTRTASATPIQAGTTSRAGRSRRIAHLGVFFGLLLFVVFGSSVAFSLFQEHTDNRTWLARVFISKPKVR